MVAALFIGGRGYCYDEFDVDGVHRLVISRDSTFNLLLG